VALAVGIVLVGVGSILESSSSSQIHGTAADIAIAVVFAGMALAAAALMSANRSPYPERSLLLTGASLLTYGLAYVLVLAFAEA
jgi:hypothetical protein